MMSTDLSLLSAGLHHLPDSGGLPVQTSARSSIDTGLPPRTPVVRRLPIHSQQKS
jgi:hypothetical protein